MQIEPWQIPVLAMAAVILPSSIVGLVGWLRSETAQPDNRPKPPGGSGDPNPSVNLFRRERLRTRTLAILTLSLLGVCFLALGPEAANILATLASAVSTTVSAALTLQSFLALQEIRKSSPQQIGSNQ